MSDQWWMCSSAMPEMETKMRREEGAELDDRERCPKEEGREKEIYERSLGESSERYVRKVCNRGRREPLSRPESRETERMRSECRLKICFTHKQTEPKPFCSQQERKVARPGP